MGQFLLICVISFIGGNFVDAQQEIKPNAFNVDYHVWSSANGGKRITIAADDQTKFITVMENAAAQNSNFRFEFIQYSFGKYITSIGGFQEDVPNKIHWMIYELDGEPTIGNPPSDSQLAPVGVDELVVKDGKSYLFWLKRVDYK